MAKIEAYECDQCGATTVDPRSWVFKESEHVKGETAHLCAPGCLAAFMAREEREAAQWRREDARRDLEEMDMPGGFPADW